MLNMKGWVIYLTHLTTAVKFTIVPDLHQIDIQLGAAKTADKLFYEAK